MKSRIVCYRLEGNAGKRSLTMPAGSEVLGAGYHQGAVGLWVRLVDATEKSDMEARVFELFETGATLDGPARYLGTCSAPGGTFCLHIVERTDRQADRAAPFEQRLEALEDNLEEIADGLRVRLEALEVSGTHEVSESVPADLLARLEALEKAPRVLATVVDPETKEPAS